MILTVLDQWIVQLAEFFSAVDQRLHLSLAILTILLPLSIWRIWKFTVCPYLQPEEPKELPYWIPSK